MPTKKQGLLIVGFLIFCIASSKLWVGDGQPHFDVLRFGARGDGRTDDSGAFVRAWNAACGAIGHPTPTLVVPGMRRFLLQPANFRGPCKSRNMHLQIRGTIVAPVRNVFRKCIESSWLVFSYIDGLSLDGSGLGTIDGQGWSWWTKKGTPINVTGKCDIIPKALKFEFVNGLQVNGMKQINGPGGQMSVYNCSGSSISNINISAPGNTPNTDGIDISHTNHLIISNSFIAVGDDCIAIKSGCSNLNITHVNCGPGHGISVGSLGTRGSNDRVEEIHVQNCSINGATNGVRIKTWPGGTGYARKISFQHITLSNTKFPIVIDQHYGDKSEKGNGVKVSDITYYDIQGTSANNIAISLNCGEQGCSNITMNQVRLMPAVATMNVSAFCRNAHGTARDTFPHVSCLS